MLNLYPNHSISEDKSVNVSYCEDYDKCEDAYDDYEYDKDYSEDYGLEAGDKLIINKISADQMACSFYRLLNSILTFYFNRWIGR